MTGQQVLVVSTDPERARSLEGALRSAGHQTMTQTDPVRAAADLREPGVDAVVIDLTQPGINRPAIAHGLSPSVPPQAPEPLEAAERRHILATLLYTGGNKRRAAQLLGIARSTLIQKVRKYGIDVPWRSRQSS